MDKPGKEYILLRRVYQGELIKARVFLLDLNGKNHKCNDVRTFPMTDDYSGFKGKWNLSKVSLRGVCQ